MDARPDEDGLIARFFAPLATSGGAHGLLDDAATLTVPPGHDLVVTTDALVSGVHVFPDDPPDLIARKALRVNLSDLAAKGAVPTFYLLTLALPDDWTADWLDRFSSGLRADQSQYSVGLLGGDTVRMPGPLTVSITALGTVPSGRALRRTGARPGDAVLVTGSIGAAALGCRIRYRPDLGDGLAPADLAHLLDRYLLPQPRVAAAPALLRFATAAMDVSDGFVGDLAKLCRASGIGATCRVEDVPLDPATAGLIARDPAHLRTALTGGDDYEILFTTAADDADACRAALTEAGVASAVVGTMDAEPGLRLTVNGAPFDAGPGRFSHF